MGIWNHFNQNFLNFNLLRDDLLVYPVFFAESQHRTSHAPLLYMCTDQWFRTRPVGTETLRGTLSMRPHHVPEQSTVSASTGWCRTHGETGNIKKITKQIQGVTAETIWSLQVCSLQILSLTGTFIGADCQLHGHRRTFVLPCILSYKEIYKLK